MDAARTCDLLVGPSEPPVGSMRDRLAAGGAFRFVNRQSSGTHQFVGIYREIASPNCLVFEAMGAVGRVILEQIGGKTRLTVKIECGSAAKLEQYLTMGIDTGTAKTLDNLAAYVSAMQQ